MKKKFDISDVITIFSLLLLFIITALANFQLIILGEW